MSRVSADRVASLLRAGRAACARRDDQAAVTHLADACRLAPELPEPAFLLCAVLLRLRSAEAGRLLEQLDHRFPDCAAGWREVGDTLSEAGKRDAALVCWSRAHRAEPSLATALRRGKLLRDLGRLAEATAVMEEAVALDPRSERAWFLLGLCRQDGRDFAGAAAAYRTALDLEPALAEAAVNLGTALQEAGDLGAAKAAYARALRARPAAFGRIAQALATAPRGELWLDLAMLRRSLTD